MAAIFEQSGDCVHRAIAAAAGALALLFLVVLPGLLPAWGADTAGDLETRVAELGATVARSGNSKLSFRLYGQINRALLIRKDGFDSNSLVVDNGTLSRARGAKLVPSGR
jgi:hypothetical protein